VKTRLTLQEKLRDLRDERKLTLAEVANSTGITLPTLGRIESSEDNRASYQDIETLAKFYDVSADYLSGITDNRQYRNVEMDALSLSDSAIETLKSKKLNNRLVSELLSHPDFQRLLNAIEVYIDKKLLPHMNTMNAVYKLAETSIRANYTVEDNDEIMAFLQNSVIDEDEFLRFRISERFNGIMKSLFDAHRKDSLPPEQAEVINGMKDMVQTYLSERQTESANKAKAILLCKQLGLNASKISDEEWRLLMKVLENSPLLKKGSRKK
jgi:transcriptional regulator with XRE-family HTH domain